MEGDLWVARIKWARGVDVFGWRRDSCTQRGQTKICLHRFLQGITQLRRYTTCYHEKCAMLKECTMLKKCNNETRSKYFKNQRGNSQELAIGILSINYSILLSNHDPGAHSCDPPLWGVHSWWWVRSCVREKKEKMNLPHVLWLLRMIWCLPCSFEWTALQPLWRVLPLALWYHENVHRWETM